MRHFMGQGCAHELISFGLCGNVKDLLMTMFDPTTLSQVITQIMRYDNRPFKCQLEKRWEPSPSLK